MRSGTSYRKAADKYRVARSTTFDSSHAIHSHGQSVNRTALHPDEEHQIEELVLRFADLRIPLNRNHLVEAARNIIESFPASANLVYRFAIRQ